VRYSATAQPRNRATAQPRNRATAQPRRAERRIIFTADAVTRPAKSPSHTVDSLTGLVGRVTRMAGASNRTVGRANRMAEPFCRTADACNHTVRPFCHTAGSANRTAGPFCHTADAFDRTAGRANRTRKPFYRAAESFYRTEKSSNCTVFRQKHAKTGKNHPFSPSRHANWSKSDTCYLPDNFSFNAPPHPGPLPQLRWRRGRNTRRIGRESATGLAGRLSANQKPPQGFSLSRRTGEGQGEGNSNIHFRSHSTHN